MTRRRAQADVSRPSTRGGEPLPPTGDALRPRLGDRAHFDFDERAREKQRSRDADEADLKSGRRSAIQINVANNMFSALEPGTLRNAKVHFPEAKLKR